MNWGHAVEAEERDALLPDESREHAAGDERGREVVSIVSSRVRSFHQRPSLHHSAAASSKRPKAAKNFLNMRPPSHAFWCTSQAMGHIANKLDQTSSGMSRDNVAILSSERCLASSRSQVSARPPPSRRS